MGVIVGKQVKESFLKGIEKLASVVKATLGAKGQTVLLEQPQYVTPIITKDGVTVANHVFLDDDLEDQAAQLLKAVAEKTNQQAGDGTTTSIVLAESIYKEGYKLISSGYNPTNIKKGIDLAVTQIVEELEKIKREVKVATDIEQVASISANNDASIGKIIAEAMEEVGREGVITVEPSSLLETKLSVTEGLQYDRGYLSPAFVTNPIKMKAEFQAPFIMLLDDQLTTIRPIFKLMEKIAATNKPLLLICETIQGEALRSMVVNCVKGHIKFCAIKNPGFGETKIEYLKDIAAVTGGSVISSQTGLNIADVKIEHLGQVKSAIVDKESTILVEGNSNKEALKERIDHIRAMIDDATDQFEVEKLQERLAKLVGGVAVISVGGATEAEMTEKKDRIDDALNATKAAVEEGIVPGGGVALMRSAASIAERPNDKEVELGYDLVIKACEAPLRTIVENAGKSGDVIVKDIFKSDCSENIGYDVNDDQYKDMIQAGIVDPKKVTRTALQNAVSITNLLLGTAGVVLLREEVE